MHPPKAQLLVLAYLYISARAVPGLSVRLDPPMVGPEYLVQLEILRIMVTSLIPRRLHKICMFFFSLLRCTSSPGEAWITGFAVEDADDRLSCPLGSISIPTTLCATLSVAYRLPSSFVMARPHIHVLPSTLTDMSYHMHDQRNRDGKPSSSNRVPPSHNGNHRQAAALLSSDSFLTTYRHDCTVFAQVSWA